MNEAAISQYITGTFDDVHPVDAWGDTFFYYNPDREQAADEIYFATLKSNDDDYDNLSHLNRPSVFRLNIGIGKESYHAWFGAPPSRHRPSDAAETSHDFTSLDQVLPHPVYAHLYWVCVLNPSAATFQTVQPLLAEAYELATRKYAKGAARR